MPHKKQRLLCQPNRDVTVVYFIDNALLDETDIQEVGKELFELVEKRFKKKLLLNFENVRYLSSASLGKLITLNKKIKAIKGQLKLCDISAQIMDVFKITKLNKLFDIYDTEEEALENFGK